MATNRNVIRLARALKDELTAVSVTTRGMRTTAIRTARHSSGAPTSPSTTTLPSPALILRPMEPRTLSRRSMSVMVSKHKAGDLAANNDNVQVSFTDNRREGDDAMSASSPLQADQQLTISPSCWKRIQQLAKRRNLSPEDIYLRVYVDAGGCSGFTYKFEMDPAPIEPEEDVVFEHPSVANLRVVVDATSLDLIRGSTIDFVEEMIKSSFEVRDNPQSESACGCGSSFALKNFAANPAID